MSIDVEKVVRENIGRTVHMSLATVKNNKPWVCEVHFAYDDDLNLYFRSTTARRHSQEISENANVAGNIVDKFELGQPPLGLYFEGTASLMQNADDRAAVLPYFEKQQHKSTEILDEAGRPDGTQFYKIMVNTWYVFGIFDGKGGKHMLEWKNNG